MLKVTGFSINAEPDSLMVDAGSFKTFSVALHSVDFSGAVRLAVAVIPSSDEGPFVSLTSSRVNLSGDSSGVVLLHVNTDDDTPPGTYSVVVTGTSHGQTHNAMVVLIVTNPSSDDESD
jgi:hypothetical protein